MTPHDTIPIFGVLWFKANIITAVVVVAIIMIARRLPKHYVKYYTIFLGTLIILRAITQHLYQVIHGTWSLQSSVPLQLCGLSAIIAGIVMFYRPQWLYEVLFYWGIPGAFHSLLTPEFTLGSQGWLFYDYYLEHGGIFLGAFYLTFVYGMKPGKGSWWRIFVYSQLLVIVVGVFNMIFDANYMYLCAKPIVENPFIVGEWPWYILGIELAGLLHFLIIYSPYWFKYYRANILVTT